MSDGSLQEGRPNFNQTTSDHIGTPDACAEHSVPGKVEVWTSNHRTKNPVMKIHAGYDIAFEVPHTHRAFRASAMQIWREVAAAA
jgi:hypothetical protein